MPAINKRNNRLRRAKKSRANIYLSGKPRLTIFKTSTHIYAQLFSFDGATVYAQSSTLESEVKSKVRKTGNIEAAGVVGKLIAERSLKLGHKEVAFDRSGFAYHGRVAKLADVAREAGLKF